MTEQRFLLIKVYDLDRLIADVEMIDGKMHVISYDGQHRGFRGPTSTTSFSKGFVESQEDGA